MSEELKNKHGGSVNVQPLVSRLREELQLSEQDATDEEILKNTNKKQIDGTAKASSAADVRRKYAELASVGYPNMCGVRLRYKDGGGQTFNSTQLKRNPELIVDFLNDWLND